MNDEELFNQVQITPNGAICLGETLVCDGFEPGYKAAAFTHIHHDHIGKSFYTCMGRYPVYASFITADLLAALNDDIYDEIRMQLKRIDYDDPQPIRTNGSIDFIKLVKSKHMLGASQILLHTKGVDILYSGDISPNDEPPKCDILVIDSTHGHPNFDKKIDSKSLERRLIDMVLESINIQKPVCVHAHRGKLQYLMHILSTHPDMPKDTKFLTSDIDMRISSIYNKHDYPIRNLLDLKSYEGEEVMNKNYPWIEFRTSMDRTMREDREQVSRVTVRGNYGNAVMRQDGTNCWVVSDEHAELTGILDYVKQAKPDVVVTDNSRTNYGNILANIITSDLRIPARAFPQ